jgi:hypothetical protein
MGSADDVLAAVAADVLAGTVVAAEGPIACGYMASLAVKGGHNRSKSAGSSSRMTPEQVQAVRAAALAVQHRRKNSRGLFDQQSQFEGFDSEGSGAPPACSRHASGVGRAGVTGVPPSSSSFDLTGEDGEKHSEKHREQHSEKQRSDDSDSAPHASCIADVAYAAKRLADDMRLKERLLAQEAALKEQLDRVRGEKLACDRRIALTSVLLRRASQAGEGGGTSSPSNWSSPSSIPQDLRAMMQDPPPVPPPPSTSPPPQCPKTPTQVTI